MTAPKRLIVNADDLGRSQGVNRGIGEAQRQGIVTSATLMVTAPAAPEVPALARDHVGLGIGLHVVLTAGRPVLPPDRVASLVDDQGLLPRDPVGLVAARSDEVLAEARAQLRRFRELLGRDPTHVDSHHHAHRLPAVLEAFVTLAWETGLPVRSLSPEMREGFRRERIPTADHFVEAFHGEGATAENLVRLVGALPLGTTELMCHPAVVDEELRTGSRYVDERARELAALTDRETRQAVQAAGVKLIHYGMLQGA